MQKTINTLKSKTKSGIEKLKQKKFKLQLSVMTALMSAAALAAPTFAASGGTVTSDAGEAQFTAVVEFFATWIGRIGLIVGFVGAIMFGLAIKNDDADAKTRGLMTLAAGFVVFGVTQALDMFMT